MELSLENHITKFCLLYGSNFVHVLRAKQNEVAVLKNYDAEPECKLILVPKPDKSGALLKNCAVI
jgi:hypothetical protein